MLPAIIEFFITWFAVVSVRKTWSFVDVLVGGATVTELVAIADALGSEDVVTVVGDDTFEDDGGDAPKKSVVRPFVKYSTVLSIRDTQEHRMSTSYLSSKFQ